MNGRSSVVRMLPLLAVALGFGASVREKSVAIKPLVSTQPEVGAVASSRGMGNTNSLSGFYGNVNDAQECARRVRQRERLESKRALKAAA